MVSKLFELGYTDHLNMLGYLKVTNGTSAELHP